ncbi:MAG: TetR/AcrR family transcriptional regulator [Paludibacteraceae bacterium]|nr:TetR/AcrR family transcriptional regulator [Paludibacteraceae bacterium]
MTNEQMVNDSMVNDSMEQRIREVAQQLFFEQGYAATSTTQIAKEVGCTQALVHYYYRTKENLFRQIFMEQILAAMNVIGRSLANEESFDLFIEQAISMYFDALSSNPSLPFFVLEELANNPERRMYMREMIVKNPTYAMLYMQFDARLKHEQQAGHIVKIDPFDLMITIASLTVFTFVSLPMFRDLLSQTDDQVREYVAHRKAEVIRMVKKILKP